MFWAPDVYRFHSLDTPLLLIGVVLIALALKSRVIKMCVFAVLLFYVIITLNGLRQLYPFLLKLRGRQVKGINLVKKITDKDRLICTNHVNAPWVLIDNPVARLPVNSGNAFVQWKSCDYLALFNGKEWRIISVKHRRPAPPDRR